MKNIVVITTQRTGSTWLMQLLDNIVHCKAYGEIFRPITSSVFKGDEKLKPFAFYKEFKVNNDGIHEYLKALKKASNGNYAFKIMYNQIYNYPESLFGISKKNDLIVHLIRSNYSDIVISSEIAKKTGVFHAEEVIDSGQLTIGPKAFLKRVRRISLQVNFMRKLLWLHPAKVLEITYEDLREDTENVINHIIEDANAEIDHLENHNTRWKKTNTKQPQKILKEYENIRKILLKNGYTIN